MGCVARVTVTGRSARGVAAACALALALVAAPAKAAQPSAGCGHAPQSLRYTDAFRSAGLDRSVLVNVPPDRPPETPLPVVLAFHSAASSARAFERYTGLTRLGNRVGFITVYPNAHGQFWRLNVPDPERNRDVRFVRDVLARLEADQCVDDSRIYAAGASNGASFAGRLGCWLSDRLAAIATVAGDDGLVDGCTPARAVSVLEIHGTDDHDVPYRGDGPAGPGGVGRFLGWWQIMDGCPPPGSRWRQIVPHVKYRGFSNCRDGASVGHVRLTGGRHAWPSTHSRRTGISFSARNAIWEFFSTGTVRTAARP